MGDAGVSQQALDVGLDDGQQVANDHGQGGQHAMIGDRVTARLGKAMMNTRSSAANPATLTLTAIQAVTGVGAPW